MTVRTVVFGSDERKPCPFFGCLGSDVRHEGQESTLCPYSLPGTLTISYFYSANPLFIEYSRHVQRQCFKTWEELPASTAKTNDKGKKVKISKMSFWRYVDSELQRIRRVSKQVGTKDKDHQDAQTL